MMIDYRDDRNLYVCGYAYKYYRFHQHVYAHESVHVCADDRVCDHVILTFFPPVSYVTLFYQIVAEYLLIRNPEGGINNGDDCVRGIFFRYIPAGKHLRIRLFH